MPIPIINKKITNARKFSDIRFTEKMAGAGLGGVITELHSPHPEVHDFLTQRPGSFSETISGIKNLIRHSITIRLNIIVNRMNYKSLPDLVEFICRDLPEISEISLTGINSTGSASANKELLEVCFSEAAPYVENRIEVAKKFNMRIGLCAAPMCAQFKVGSEINVTSKKYLAKECGLCCRTNECTGIWRSHIDSWGQEVKPILRSRCVHSAICVFIL